MKDSLSLAIGNIAHSAQRASARERRGRPVRCRLFGDQPSRVGTNFTPCHVRWHHLWKRFTCGSPTISIASTSTYAAVKGRRTDLSHEQWLIAQGMEHKSTLPGSEVRAGGPCTRISTSRRAYAGGCCASESYAVSIRRGNALQGHFQR
jgi:hypothetical protein